jgi:hypothetical protein
MNPQNLTKLVSSCGLYCGACHKYQKGKCPGCADNEKASWCKIRICTKERGYTTCAVCTEYNDVLQCRKFNTFFSKIFAFIFRSDRPASLKRIEEKGLEVYAREMDAKGLVVIKKT